MADNKEIQDDSSQGVSYVGAEAEADSASGISLDPEGQETLVLQEVKSEDNVHARGGSSPNQDDNVDLSAGSRPDYPVPVGDIFCWKHISGFSSFFTLTWGWLVVNKSQILSGITVALAQVPEAVSFSFVAGVEPLVGLQSAWILGIFTSLFGGRPGMVAGSTGAVAIVLPSLVEKHGVGYMFYAIMLAGIIQMVFGLLRLGVLVRMIPHPVMVGFCNGLGIVIGVAQFNIFKIRPEPEEEGRKLFETFGAFAPFTNGWEWVDGTMVGWMCFHIAIALITYALFPRLTNAIPASLAAIIMTTIFEHALVRPVGYETNTVSDLAQVKGNFPVPVWFDKNTSTSYADEMPTLNGETFGIILPVSITVAAIGLLESLLTLELIDEMTNTKGNGNREAFGQGLGQFFSGMLGGMGGCTTIGQSMMNLHSGGYTRLSSSVAAIFMLLIILVAYPLINLIPVAGLAGVMFVVTYYTIEWESAIVVLGSILPQKLRLRFGYETKVKRSDVLIMLIVVVVTLILDLAIAVGVGIAVSCLIFAWDAGTRLTFSRAESSDGQSVVYSVGGPIFFGSIKPLMDLFPDPRTEPKNVTVLFEQAEVHDWSGMMAIKRLHERFENNDATVQFQKLNVASRRLMHKSKDLWEGVNVFTEEDVNVEDDPLVKHDHVHENTRM
jgi:SulP family sulfate permease